MHNIKMNFDKFYEKDHKNDFPQLIDRSNFIKRRRRLHPFLLYMK